MKLDYFQLNLTKAQRKFIIGRFNACKGKAYIVAQPVIRTGKLQLMIVDERHGNFIKAALFAELK